MANPYSQKLPVEINELPTYRKVVREIVQRTTNGLSLWMEGDRLVRSSVLRYLASAQNREIFDNSESKTIISLIECPLLGKEVDGPRFWKACFAPFTDLSEKQKIPEPIISAYNICQQNNFDTYKIVDLIAIMSNHHYRIILLFNELDYLLDLVYKQNKIDVFEDWFQVLRNISSNYFNKLAIVISARPSDLQRFPALIHNFVELLHLPSLTQRELASILSQPGSIFTAADRKYILTVAGKNLHVLRIVADTLWEEIISSKSRETHQRYVAVGYKVHELTKTYYTSIWKLWDINTRQVVMALGLIEMPNLIEAHKFSTGQLQKDISSARLELEYLTRAGVVSEPDDSGRCKFLQGALLWWLADELVRILRKEQSLEEWLLQRELKGGVITQSQFDYLNKATNSLSEFLEKGASAFIEAYAKALVH